MPDINSVQLFTVKIVMLKGEKGDKGAGSYDDTEVRGLISTEAQTRAREDASIQLEIDNLRQAVLLWSNPSPNAGFSAQTINISVNADEYDGYEIIYKDKNDDDDGLYNTGFIPKGNSNNAVLTSVSKYSTGSGTNWDVNRRPVSNFPAGNAWSFTFGDAKTDILDPPALTSTAHLIPQKIIGYKHYWTTL